MKMCPSLPTALLSRCTSYMLGWKAASNPRGSGHLNSPHNTRKQQGSSAIDQNRRSCVLWKCAHLYPLHFYHAVWATWKMNSSRYIHKKKERKRERKQDFKRATINIHISIRAYLGLAKHMLGWKAASNPRGSGLNSPHNTRKQQGSGAMLWNSNGLLKFKSDSDSGDSGGEAVEAALGLMQTPYRPTQITYSCSPGPATGMQSSTTNAHYITSNAVSLDNRMHGVNTTTLCIKHPYIPGQTSMHKHRL